MKTTDQNILTRWTSVLADPDREAAFRASTLPVERTTMRVGALVILAVDVLAQLVGKLVTQHQITTTEMVVQFVSLVMLMIVYTTLGRIRAAWWRPAVLVSGLILSLIIASMVAYGQNMTYRGGLLIPPCILVIYLVMRLDLATLTFFAIVNSVLMFSAWLSTLTEPGLSSIAFLFSIILVANALGFVESRRAQRERRIVFHQEQILTRHATVDDLTGLGNRRIFYEMADRELTKAGTADGIAILLIDLDRFKEINDTLGHYTGDQLLRQIASRMRSALPEAVALARLGGDEYAALLVGDPATSRAEDLAQRFLLTLDEPFELEGLALHMQASIGIALRQRGEDRQTLLRHADIAMYQAKHRGGGIKVYSLDDCSRTREQVELASELNDALDNDQVDLYYQPKTRINTGVTETVEALIRWQHPVRGLLTPERFLPVAERHGLMRKLTLHVLTMALHQAEKWQQSNRRLRISVNLAPESLLDARFPDDVLQLLASTTVSASTIQMEITENTLLLDPDRMQNVITRLGDAGFKFALDDYGTGYSSLSYLRLLPLDELKIDRSFVTNLTADPDNAVIVRSTIQMARELGFHVVAEGVEDSATLQTLSRYGCDTAQGYFLSPPLPATELESWLDQRRVQAAEPVESTA